MERIKIFEMPSLYREPLEITGFRFGGGEKSAAVVGAMRGNEIQQLYICSQLVRRLKAIEEAGGIRRGAGIEVIPCVNPYSINIGKRFWAMDDTDINRMFPGYDQGETTQRIAAGLFEHLQGWRWGIHFASYYIRGGFMPHVRMMQTDFGDPVAARDFGLSYVMVRKPLPIDTATLNYNWQIWDTRAYTIFTASTESIDAASSIEAVDAVLRFFKRQGLIDCDADEGVPSVVIQDADLCAVHAPAAGIFHAAAAAGSLVQKGALLGEILDSLEGDVLCRVLAPMDGHVFFACTDALVMQRQILFELVQA